MNIELPNDNVDFTKCPQPKLLSEQIKGFKNEILLRFDSLDKESKRDSRDSKVRHENINKLYTQTLKLAEKAIVMADINKDNFDKYKNRLIGGIVVGNAVLGVLLFLIKL